MDYLKRIADEELSLRLEAFGAVQINAIRMPIFRHA